MRRPKKSSLVVWFLISLSGILCLVSGCGYSITRPFRTDVKTIYVEPFATREFRRRIELDLTEAIKKRISLDTPYKIARNRAEADTVLTGEVLEVEKSASGRDFDLNLPRESQLTLIVSFQWKDLRTGDILAKYDNFRASYSYSTVVGEPEYIGLQGAINRIAERIVEQLEADW